MELAEKIETINQQLIDLYGIDTITGDAMWRVAWSEDQFEHRLGTYDDFVPGTNIYLRTVTEVRYVPKYRQWIKEKYVLERLVLIPEDNSQDLPKTKVSYEPIFPFEDSFGNYLPPVIGACQLVISCILAVEGKGNLARYKDPLDGLTTDELIEAKRQEIDQLQEELFGNETDTGDALAHGEAIVVPNNYRKVN